MNEYKLKVDGMHCRSCVMLIQEELADLGAKDIRVEHKEGQKSGSVSLKTDKPKSTIVAAIEALGEYKVHG